MRGSFPGAPCTRVIQTPLFFSVGINYSCKDNIDTVIFQRVSDQLEVSSGETGSDPESFGRGKVPALEGVGCAPVLAIFRATESVLVTRFAEKPRESAALRLLGGAALTSTLLSMAAQNGDQTMSFTREEMLIKGMVQLSVMHLIEKEGIAIATVLAMAHAEITACIAGTFGGSVAADCLEIARLRVQQLAALPPAVAADTGPVTGRMN